jgi:hypothetical protein
MNRKHFEAVAAEMNAALQNAKAYGSPEAVAELKSVVARLGRVFSDFNQHFDSVRFAEACGVRDN